MEIYGSGKMTDYFTNGPFYNYRYYINSVVIKDGVTSIGDCAFQESGLKSIYIPKSVSSISYYAFGACYKLEAINVSVENQAYMSKEGVLFSYDGPEIIVYPSGKKGSYSIPYGVEKIGEYVFSCCSQLSYISIPSSIYSVGSYAFEYCSGLSSIIIPSSVTKLDSYAFGNCDKLSLVIYLGESISDISGSSYAFDDCPNLKEVHVLPSYGSNSFCGENVKKCINTASCGASTTFIFDNCGGTLFISGKGAMSDYTNYPAPWSSYKDNIISVIIEGEVTSVGNDSFSECSELTSVTILSFVVSIGDSSFSGCSNLEIINFEKESKLTIIGNYSFYGCSKLKSIIFDEQTNLITIGDFALSNCSNLETISFYGCNQLKSISIPSSIKYFKYFCFYNCSKLENIIFEKESNLTIIGESTFYGCSNLESISIPSTVSEIRNKAFYECSNLENITFEEKSNLTIVGNYSFSNCNNLKTIELPTQLKEISSHSFERCNKLKSITILSNISEIQEYAFLKCSNLECILYYGTNNPEIIYDNSFSGCEKLSFIITYLTYSSETFGSFKVRKTSELPLTCKSKSNRLKSGEIASIVICSFIFIVIICVVLFFTVFRKMKNKTADEYTP